MRHSAIRHRVQELAPSEIFTALFSPIPLIFCPEAHRYSVFVVFAVFLGKFRFHDRFTHVGKGGGAIAV